MVIKRVGKIVIGCFVIIVVLAILGTIFGGLIIKKLITGSIRQKTGVEVNIDDGNGGNLSYTDPTSGQTLSIGQNKIPDNFPKDFPVYPGSTVTTSLSGNQTTDGGGERDNVQGFWLTFTTDDTSEKVKSFYEEKLVANNWKFDASVGSGQGINWVISKDNLSGYLTIENKDNKTSILVILGLNN